MTPEAGKTVILKASVVFCLARGGVLIPLWRRPYLSSGKIIQVGNVILQI